jgi:hypothetical protein
MTKSTNGEIDNNDNKYLVLENDCKISPSGLYKLFLSSNDNG